MSIAAGENHASTRKTSNMAPQLSENGPLGLTEKDELTASATASLEGSVENSSEKVFVEWETLRDDQVDAVFREPGVKTGYRLPNQSWSYYVISLFHVHNETLNTWTHLVGCLIMIYQLYSYASIHGLFVDESRRVIHMFNLCTVLYTFLSTVLHLFHSKSEFVHFVCCQGDYAGIALNTYCSGLGAFYISSHNEYFFRWLEPFFLPLNTTLAWLSYLGSSYAKVFCSGKRSSMRKVLQIGSVVVHIAISCAPVFIRYYECFRSDSCSMSSMSHHTSYLTVLAVSAVFFSSHIPETLFPGKFDIIGQGHQIFHVMVILFSLQQGWAAEIEIELLEKFFPRSFPSWPMLMTSLFTVCLLDLCSAVILGRFVQRKLDKTKHM